MRFITFSKRPMILFDARSKKGFANHIFVTWVVKSVYIDIRLWILENKTGWISPQLWYKPPFISTHLWSTSLHSRCSYVDDFHHSKHQLSWLSMGRSYRGLTNGRQGVCSWAWGRSYIEVWPMTGRGCVHELVWKQTLCLVPPVMQTTLKPQPSLRLSAHSVKECEEVTAGGAESTWNRNALVSLHTV